LTAKNDLVNEIPGDEGLRESEEGGKGDEDDTQKSLPPVSGDPM
jgi:hypothetical protein